MRKLRYVPQSQTLVSITNRTIQGRYLLRPGPAFNDIFLGILGRTQRLHEMSIAAVSVLSNHFHLLLIVDDAREVSEFMRDLQSKMAREVNRLTGWKGPVFERRYEMTVVTGEEPAQIERLKYVLANGVKENLVERVSQWPGVHSAEALIHGTPLAGHWFDRTRQYAARNQGEELSRDQFVFAESVVLSPIPCWAHLPADRYRERMKTLVEEVDAEAALARQRSGAKVLGVKAILAQDPQARPTSVAATIGRQGSRRQGNPGPGSASPAHLSSALPCAARPRGDESRAQDVLRDLRGVCERLPGSRRGSPPGPPGCALPRWQLPARVALRGRLIAAGGLFDSLSVRYRAIRTRSTTRLGGGVAEEPPNSFRGLDSVQDCRDSWLAAL